MKRIDIYDFDATLFRSPQEPFWYDRQTNPEWHHNIKSLQEVCLPAENKRWVEPVVREARESISDPDTYAIVCTGRKTPFTKIVRSLLKSKGLKFDEVMLKDDGRTEAFKKRVIDRLMKRFPNAVVHIWEDRHHHLDSFMKHIEMNGGLGVPHAVKQNYSETQCTQNAFNKFANTEQEDKKIIRFQYNALIAFKDVLKDLKSYGEQAKSEHKGKDKDSINKRKKHIQKAIENLTQVKIFLDKYVSKSVFSDRADSWRKSTVSLMRDYLAGVKTLSDVSSSFENSSVRYFKSIELHKQQSKLKKTIPSELRAFLPDTITIDVDKEGNIQTINEMFGNKTYTLAEKINVQKKLIADYNSIVEKIQTDLKSEDEMKRLSALITSIIMETGIRPGKIGNGCIETVDDQKIEVETFGAITLNTKHVDFVKENFVELKFKGKKGTVNTATLSDENIIKILKNYVNKAKESSTDYIFVNEEGVQYNYQDLIRYFKSNFKNFKITDFRKLRATQEVFDSLKEERNSMLKQIKKFQDLETEELTQKVVDIIAETINKAHERAQVALSHDKSTTTKKSYINPAVILSFLSTTKMQDTLKDCISTGKTKLHFDPMMFVRESKTASVSEIRYSGGTLENLDTIADMLDHIFKDDDTID